MSLVSLYYYLQIIRQMYIEEPVKQGSIKVSRVTLGVLGVLLAGMVFLGVYPAPLMDAIQNASDAIFSTSFSSQLMALP